MLHDTKICHWEVEYITCCEVTWIIDVLSDLKFSGLDSVDLLCDNNVSIQIVLNSIFHERTRHIKIDCHLVWDYVIKGVIMAKFISSDTQLTDVFTKALSSLSFEKMSSNLSLVNWFRKTIK